MSSTWVKLARTGNPNNPGIRHWPASSVHDRKTLLFDDSCRVASDLRHAARIETKKVLHLA